MAHVARNPVEENNLQAKTTGWAACRSVFQCGPFGWLWVGQAISQIGDGLNRVALLWFVYELTGSAFKMTVVGLLQTLPPLALGAIAGVYLDRLPKRGTMIVLDLARAALLMLIPLLYGMQALTLTSLYVLVFVIAMAGMAFGPTLNAAIPLLVGRNELTAANAIMQSTATFGMLFGPAMSGVGIAWFGVENVLYANATAFAVSALCKVPLRLARDTARGVTLTAQAFLNDFRVGLRFVFVQQRIALLLMIMVALYNLGSTGFIFLLPVIAKNVLHVGATQLGLIWSALGVGMLITSAWLAWADQQALCNRVWLISIAAVLEGLAILAIRVVANPFIAVFWVLIIGAGAAIVMPVVAASLQELTPKEMMARVFSIFNTGAMSSAMLGMVVFGWAADKIGPATTLILCGMLQLITAGMGILFTRWCTWESRRAVRAA